VVGGGCLGVAEDQTHRLIGEQPHAFAHATLGAFRATAEASTEVMISTRLGLGAWTVNPESSEDTSDSYAAVSSVLKCHAISLFAGALSRCDAAQDAVNVPVGVAVAELHDVQGTWSPLSAITSTFAPGDLVMATIGK